MTTKGRTQLLKITYSKRFHKHYQKLQTEEKKRVKHKIKLLFENPLHPSLRSKRIKGTVDLFECSVNMDLRIIWYYEGRDIVMLLDVGHHDLLNHY